MIKRIYHQLSFLCQVISFLFWMSCSSYQQFRHITQDFEIPHKIFTSGYHQTWLATIQVLKQYDLELQDQEGGVIKTRWIDNTVELNFSDSFGANDAVKSAKFKIIVNVIKGFRYRREVTKVNIYRRQMVEKDFLQGWKIVPSDGIMEQMILYRIGREIGMRNKINQIEKEKNNELETSF